MSCHSVPIRSAALIGAICLSATAAVAGVDSVVTFNEIQYHPTAAQTTGEWVELMNQNSVDVDLSGWRLDGGIDYVFPNGTVIRGGKYVVVAADPAALMAATGLTGVLGPFANQLSNESESVTLKNINGRRMDEIAYDDRSPWPVAADGSGATLAKIDEMHDSGTPENWRASVAVGGTPGTYNFTDPNPGGAPVVVGVPGPVKRYYPLDGAVTNVALTGFNGGLVNAPVYSAEFPPIVGAGQSIDLDGVNQAIQVTDANHPVAYTIAAWVKPDVIRAQSIVLRTNGAGPTSASGWSHQLRMTAAGTFEHFTLDGTARSVIGTTTAVAGQWYHVAGVAAGNGAMRLFVNGAEEGAATTIGTLWKGGTRWMIGSNSGNGMAFFDGRIDDIAIWLGPMNASQVGHIATGFRLPTEAALTNLALGRKVIDGSGSYPNLAFNGFNAGNDFSAGNVTDGSASDLVGSNYWLGRDGVATERFTLDLGTQVEISQILLRNTHHSQFNDRGTAGFRLLAAAGVDGDNQLVAPAEILAGTLTTRSGEAPIRADAFDSSNGLNPVTARFLQFEALGSSYASGGVGLNEIEVFGNPLADPTGGGRVPSPLVINELTDDDAPTFWLELFNFGPTPLALDGFVLKTETGASYTFPPTSLAAGGFLVVDETQLGFRPLDGDRVFLFSQGMTSVIDGVVTKAQRHQARRPGVAGAPPGEFLNTESAADKTPGAVNRVALSEAVVINEIMYHRHPQFLPYVENDEEWLELYNRSDAPVSLDGWRLDVAVSYTFPAGTSLAAGEYLVVANDAVAFSAVHPGVRVVGDFDGGLSNRGERIVLRDALGNAVDDVFYRDKEPWPIYTDGLGCSLELKNPGADNAVPESWAASDESSRSQWQDYSFTATAATPIYSPTISPGKTGTTAFHELRMALLEEGEALVDDVSVREITTAPTVELMQNGSFTAGTTATWRLLGNHETSGIVDNAGNPALRLTALGPMLYMHNLLESTLKASGSIVPVVNGRQYTISLRAKWLRGCPWLHTEIYYNKVAKTFLLDLPAVSGTPGAQNSTYQPNLGPSVSGALHAPAVPSAGTAVTVTARVTDPQGVAAATLQYRVNNAAAFTAVPMTAGSDGVYSGVIPGQAANAITQFYVEATDAAVPPVTATWPAAGPASRALIKVNEGAAPAGKQNLRIITTAADATALASATHMMSNRRRGCTIIYNEREIFYDGSMRLRGSMFSRSDPDSCGQSLHFPSDHLFRGTQRTVSVRRSGLNEIIVKHAINRAGGLPDNYNDIINIVSYRSGSRGPARMEMERFSNSWLDDFYPEGSDGTLFKMEGIRVPTLTFANGSIPAGNPEGIKNLTTNGIGWVANLDLADLGPDGEQYRHSFRWLNNFSRNDNARFVTLCRAMSLPVSTPAQAQVFEATIESVMDVDEWMRCFAMMSLFGIGDAYSQGNPHNLNFYMPPTPDGRIAAIPWDWNFVFSQATNAPLTGDRNIQKVISRPRFKRLFLGHMKNIIDTTFNTAYMNSWLANLGANTGESYTAFSSNISGRGTYVTNQIKVQVPVVAFGVTTNGGADFSVDSAKAVLEGDGWVDVREIRLNDSPESLPVTWLDNNSWRVTVPLATGPNAVTLTALNAQGQPVGTDSVVITNTSIVEQASDANTVVSELHYQPASARGAEFIEIMNISPVHRIDLSGCAFTAGIEYAFPASTFLNPGQRLVITADQFMNATALSNGGERVTLEAPGGTIIKSFVYDDAPPWPAAADGTGPSLVLIAPLTNPDHSDPLNWRASMDVGGSPGGEDAIVHLLSPPGGDDDGDGLSNLLEYALGDNPRLTHAMTADGLTLTVPRVANADDAKVFGQASAAFGDWIAADLIDATATTLTFRVPASLAAGKQVFLRAAVQVR